jgi:7-carboxy-7-deazaguanine synthase
MTDYNKILPVLELYLALQSEGSLAGRPHIIIRTTGCTHRCYFGKGGWCDSWYTSISPEKGKYTLENIKNFFNNNKDVTHLMLTGGSPTMHPELCNNIVNIFQETHKNQGVITLETEGSHPLYTDIPINLISLSPKFSNSIPQLGVPLPKADKLTDQKMIDQHNKFRIKENSIKQLLEYHTDYQLKPVVNPITQPEVWEEIKEFIDKFNIPKSKIWIMPPGDNKDELILNYPDVIQFCTDNSYNFSGRDHIIAFGDKREV